MSSWREPEWDDESVALMVAYDRVVRNTGRYGEWLPDATSPGADPNNYKSGFGYRPDGPFTNWAEKQVLDTTDAWKKTAGKNPNMNGLYWTVERYEFPTAPSGA